MPEAPECRSGQMKLKILPFRASILVVSDSPWGLVKTHTHLHRGLRKVGKCLCYPGWCLALVGIQQGTVPCSPLSAQSLHASESILGEKALWSLLWLVSLVVLTSHSDVRSHLYVFSLSMGLLPISSRPYAPALHLPGRIQAQQPGGEWVFASTQHRAWA